MAEQRKLPHGLQFAPIKVGVLIDLDMGTKDDFLATLRVGFDEAYEGGIITRPVELIVKEAIGLPRLEAKNSIDGYRELVAAGVLCTIGPLITDNSLALAPVINELGVPAVTWTGTDRYFGDYCFNLGNGGLAEEAAIMATWIRRNGYKTVGMIHEISPGGVEYAANFRYYAAREGLDILIESYTTQVPDDLEGVLRKIRDQRPDCLAYLGYGYPTILMGPMFKSLQWNAGHDHRLPVLLRQAGVDGGARRLARHRSDVRGESAPAAGIRSRRGALGQAPRPYGHCAELRHGALDRRGHRAGQPADAERSQGGAREGAHAAGGQRRPAHAHEPRAVRSQGVQGRLAAAPQDRRRQDRVRRPALAVRRRPHDHPTPHLSRLPAPARPGAAGGLYFGGKHFTFGDLSAAVDGLAAWLVQRGLGAGDHIGVMAANEPAVVGMMFAVWAVGGVAVPIAVRSTAPEATQLLTHSRARAVLCDTSRTAVAREAAAAAGVAAYACEPTVPLRPRIIRRGAPRPKRPSTRAPRPDDLAVLAYTSGTTGAPQGA